MKWTNANPEMISTALTLGLILTATNTLANNFNIDVSNDDIAVEASNASLKELLEELEKLTGIPVQFVAETDERVTLNVGMTSIENAIGKITPNHMIVHESLNGKNVIKELVIIPAESDLSSGGSGSNFLPSGNPAPAIEQPQVTQSPSENPPTNQPMALPEGEPALPQPPVPRNDGQDN